MPPLLRSPPFDGELSEGLSSDAASDPELAQSGLTITLPSAPPAQLEPITLPIPAAAIAPPVATELYSITAEPLLVGTSNHSGNGGGSAIFQLGDLSVSSFPGEPIGNSGWTLRSVSANGAVMEREGAQRSLSVGGAPEPFEHADAIANHPLGSTHRFGAAGEEPDGCRPGA